MNARRVAAPPRLPGFELVELIGSGGYADVYLYQQMAPRRQVAIKIVDTAALDSRTATDYTEEANVMAMVSAHPHIVQVFQASVSPDGRPFLVMEYYPNQNFHERARTEQLSVAEVLRVGIQIASAVETAHRAGILHRDIKPANILTSEFNHPGLTDFGIAAVAGQADQSGDGLSIPWSPPEALGEAPTLIQSDVYSLAATVYTMLAGHAPFEIKGGDNRPLAMMARIEREPVPPIGRADVPRMLERVLVGAMSKDPSARPATAADLARQLQEVESSMQLPVTPLQLRDNVPVIRSRVSEKHDDDATRVKGIISVEAQATRVRQPLREARVAPTVDRAAESPRPTLRRARSAPTPAATAATPPALLPTAIEPSAAAARERSRQPLLPDPGVGDTVQRVDLPAVDLAEYETSKPIPKLWLALGAAAAVIALIVGVTLLVDRGASAEPILTTRPDIGDNVDQLTSNDGGSISPTGVAPLPLPEIEGVKGDDGVNRFTWKDMGDGVTYSITIDGDPSTIEVETNEFQTDKACIQVQVIAASGLVSPATEGCVL